MSILFHVNNTPPYDISGSYAHYIGDDLVDTNGWPDASGNGLDLADAQGTRSIRDNGPNCHKYFRFEDNTGRVRRSIPPVATECTYLAVVRNYAPEAAKWELFGAFAFGARYVDAANCFKVKWDKSLNRIRITGLGAQLMPYITMGNDWICGDTTSDWHLVSFRYNNVANWYQGAYTGHFRQNGVDIGTGDVIASDNSGANYIIVGMDYNANSLDVMEVIYYQRVLDDVSFQYLENQLMAKYNIGGVSESAPEIPFTETFTGEDDSNPACPRWLTWNDEGDNLRILSNKLRMSDTGSNPWLYFSWYLEGDFDIQVDYTAILYPSTDNWGFYLQAWDPGVENDYFQVTRRYTTADGQHIEGSSSVSSSTAADQFSYSGTTGKLRVVRSGTTWNCYYDVGSGWVLLHTRTGTTADLTIWLGVSGIQTATVDYDNFTFNSGTGGSFFEYTT